MIVNWCFGYGGYDGKIGLLSFVVDSFNLYIGVFSIDFWMMSSGFI